MSEITRQEFSDVSREVAEHGTEIYNLSQDAKEMKQDMKEFRNTLQSQGVRLAVAFGIAVFIVNGVSFAGAALVLFRALQK